MSQQAMRVPCWKRRHALARPRTLGVILFLSLFVFQFSVSLLLHPENQILCLEELNNAASAAGHAHHHDKTLAALPTHPDGNTMQHCKDTVFGITVTPLQPFTIPFAFTSEGLTKTWVSPVPEWSSLCERTVAPPHQPPRV